MSKPTGPTNPILQNLIAKLREKSAKEEVKIWADLAKRLSKPTRRRVVVNLAKIDRHAKRLETIVVPGKVLAAGNLSKPVNVAAFSFSETARTKILAAKGKSLTIEQLMTQNPKGSKVRIVV